jgi:TolB-like protein
VETVVLASLEPDRVPAARPIPGKEVSKSKPVEFVPTGYADLDKLLYGGIASNSAVVLTSPSCSERDQLIKSFLETGAKTSEVAFYLTTNPGPMKTLAEEYQSNFHLFVCNPQADAIVEDAPNVVKLKGVENITDISIALASAIRKLDPSLKGARRICIGLISDILLQHHAVPARRWLAGLIPELQSEGFTILAIMDPEMHPPQEVRAVLDLFDGEISVREKETEKGSAKFLKIQKMSGQKYLEDEVILKKTEQAVLDKHRIAVLPFVNMSPDPNDEYFADGMTEETISTVSGISGLNIISRTSVMHYKKTEKTVKEIARELEVGSVLEGSFRKAGNRIRVTTQLIDVAADKHLWAQNYDRNLDDIFAVQSDIAKQVAEALRVRILSPERERIEKKPTESTSAYTLYLKGRHFWNLRALGSTSEATENLKNALRCFEQAVAEDPSFALGYVGKADCYVILCSLGCELEANLKRAKEMVGRALELDPELAEAHATNGFILGFEYRFKDEESELRKAIELKPSYAMAHHWYYLLLSFELRWEEALEQIEKALELDPLSPVFNNGLAWFYYYRRDYGKALEQFRKAAELGALFARLFVARVYGRMKMYADMRREFAAWVELEKGSFPFARAIADFYTAYFENDIQKCRNILHGAETLLGKETLLEAFIGAFEIAVAYFGLGENDKGFEWLERSYSRREAGFPSIRLEPELDGVCNDPRYLDLMKRLGLDQTAQPTS